MKALNIFLITILALSISNGYSADGKKYGKKITLKDKTKVSEILEKPESYLGKSVLINGTIVDVCSKRGCWIEVASDKPYQKIKVKVNDGEIVFPMSAKGKNATVQGEVYKITLTKEQAIEKMKHDFEEYGTPYDTTKAQPTTIYQIKGHGALIK